MEEIEGDDMVIKEGVNFDISKTKNGSQIIEEDPNNAKIVAIVTEETDHDLSMRTENSDHIVIKEEPDNNEVAMIIVEEDNHDISVKAVHHIIKEESNNTDFAMTIKEKDDPKSIKAIHRHQIIEELDNANIVMKKAENSYNLKIKNKCSSNYLDPINTDHNDLNIEENTSISDMSIGEEELHFSKNEDSKNKMKIYPRCANFKSSDKKLAEFAIENEDFDLIKGKSVTISRPIPAEPEVESSNCSVPDMSVTRNALNNASSSTGSEITSETVVVSRTELDNVLKRLESLENENKISNKIQSEQKHQFEKIASRLTSTMDKFDTFVREAKEDRSCMKNLMLTLIEKITPNQDANKSENKSVNLLPVSMIKKNIFTPEEYDTENTTHSPVPHINILPVHKDDSNTYCDADFIETCKRINRNTKDNPSKGLKRKNVVEDSTELASCVADFEDTFQEAEETQSTQEELNRNSLVENSPKLSSIPGISSSGIECHAIYENVDEEMIPVHSNSKTANSKKNNRKIYKKPPRPCPFCQKSFVTFKRHLLQTHASEPEIKFINTMTNKREKTLEIKKLRMKGLAVQNEMRMKRGEEPIAVKRCFNKKEHKKSMCLNCKGIFSRRNIFLHKRNCYGEQHVVRCGSLPVDIVDFKLSINGSKVEFPQNYVDIMGRLRTDIVGSIIRKEHLLQYIGFDEYERIRHKITIQRTRTIVLAHVRNMASIFYNLNLEKQKRRQVEISFSELFDVKMYQQIKNVILSLSGEFSETGNGYSSKAGAMERYDLSLNKSIRAMIIYYKECKKDKEMHAANTFFSHVCTSSAKLRRGNAKC